MELLRGNDPELATRVGAHQLHVIEPLEPPPAGLLDHLPGSALLLVVLASDGTDDLAREPAHVVLVLPLLIGEGEVHFQRPPSRCGPRLLEAEPRATRFSLEID